MYRFSLLNHATCAYHLIQSVGNLKRTSEVDRMPKQLLAFREKPVHVILGKQWEAFQHTLILMSTMLFVHSGYDCGSQSPEWLWSERSPSSAPSSIGGSAAASNGIDIKSLYMIKIDPHVTTSAAVDIRNKVISINAMLDVILTSIPNPRCSNSASRIESCVSTLQGHRDLVSLSQHIKRHAVEIVRKLNEFDRP